MLKLLRRWRSEAIQAGREVRRIVVAYEAGRDGFWLARWLQARAVEAYVIHPSSVAVSREHRRAKTYRLDTELLMRAFLAGCGARSATAAWQPSQPSMRRRLAVRTVNGQARPRTYTDRQSHQGNPCSLRHSRLQTQSAQSCRETGGSAYGGRYAPTGTKPSRVAP